MKSRSKNRAARRQSKGSALTAAPPRMGTVKTPWWRSWWVRFFAFVGAITTIYAAYSGVEDQIRKSSPDVRVSESDPQSPFLFPFSVRNDTVWLTMTNVRWSCVIKKLEAGPLALTDVSLGTATTQIAPQATQNFNCPIIIPKEWPAITTLKIVVEVKYKTLGIERTKEVPFSWFANASQPRWIEGIPPK